LVDACMRALQQTRWINFRMRAMLMSFSSYDLWLHWRQPALHLARMFLDYEPGIHYPQSQMQSGVTGINTIRVYSPTKQAQDQDPQGEFIRRYIPELAACPTAFVHQPWLMSRDDQQRFGCWLGRDYPLPLVDHQVAAKSAQQRIYAIRRSASAVTEAATVLKKHGSRKRRDPSPKVKRNNQNLLPGFDEE
ncbi:MAG: FAD-binding domain-containing protein, partial [Planctomycetota bacterium]